MSNLFFRLFKKKCKHEFDTISIVKDEAVLICCKCGVIK